LGIAIDITEMKTRELRAAQKWSDAVQHNRKLLGFVSRNVDGVRGPFETVLGMFAVLREGFIDFGDGKLDQLDLCTEMAGTALDQINDLCRSADGLIGDVEAPRQVDLGHLCRDIIAIVDPDGRFDIGFPDCSILADHTALELLLRQLIENASRYAHRIIRIDVEEALDGMLCFRVLDDGKGEHPTLRSDGTEVLPAKSEGRDLSEVGRARSVIESRDGSLGACMDDSGRVGIEFTLRGSLGQSAAWARHPETV
jgi:signal transduction histidine kinase